jgi:hypothetical protein
VKSTKIKLKKILNQALQPIPVDSLPYQIPKKKMKENIASPPSLPVAASILPVCGEEQQKKTLKKMFKAVSEGGGSQSFRLAAWRWQPLSAAVAGRLQLVVGKKIPTFFFSFIIFFFLCKSFFFSSLLHTQQRGGVSQPFPLPLWIDPKEKNRNNYPGIISFFVTPRLMNSWTPKRRRINPYNFTVSWIDKTFAHRAHTPSHDYIWASVRGKTIWLQFLSEIIQSLELGYEAICISLFPSLMNLALMDYPDKRIKPPNYHTLCNYSYHREPELPSSPIFFFSLHRRFPGNGWNKTFTKKNDQTVHNPYNFLGYFCIPVR